MNCRELFIGGYYDNDGDIIRMDSSKLSYILEIGGEYEYEPIPLTEEWLLKFGFQKYNDDPAYGQEFFDSGISIFYKECAFRFYTSRTNRAWSEYEYVHEIQNIYFALTGEELTIE